MACALAFTLDDSKFLRPCPFLDNVLNPIAQSRIYLACVSRAGSDALTYLKLGRYVGEREGDRDEASRKEEPVRSSTSSLFNLQFKISNYDLIRIRVADQVLAQQAEGNLVGAAQPQFTSST
jgi:hypothetical protein